MEDKTQRFETVRARNAALLLFAESQDYRGTLERLKAFTGGDTINAEGKSTMKPFEYTFRGLVILVGNSPVRVRDNSSAVFSRMRSIHLDQAIPLAERRELLSWKVDHWDGELADELGSFVHWVLAMDPQEARKILETPGGVAQLDEMFDMVMSDSLAEWADATLLFDDQEIEGSCCRLQIGNASLEEGGTVNPTNWTGTIHAYAHYRRWMAGQGNQGKELALRRFKSLLVGLLRDRLELPLPKGLMSQPPYKNREGSGIPMLRPRMKGEEDLPGVIRFALQRRVSVEEAPDLSQS
jgi:putative DNA primase/helicase